MSHLNPGTQLFFFSGLIIFWLIPLSSWAMLRGQRDSNANLWFAGTALYSVVVSLFVFSPHFPLWVRGPLISALSGLSVLCLTESLRRELWGKPTPWAVYAAVVLLWFVTILVFFEVDLDPLGRAVHLVAISLLEFYVLYLANRVRRQHGSRALWVVIATIGAFALSNLSRVLEFALTGRFALLQDFTLAGSAALVMNYVSAIFYCYGYWGFVVEKGRQRLLTANEQVVLARTAEAHALAREQVSQELLQERTALMARLSATGKMAQSGALSATLAHEINQPLASIQLNVEEAQRLVHERGATELLERLLGRIQHDNQRAATIVQRVRALFSPGQVQLQSQVVDDLVRFVVSLLDARLRQEGVALHLTLDAAAPFQFSSGELEHALLNLLDNALQALRQVNEMGRRIDICTWRADGQVHLAVSDNGPGVPESLRAHVFELSASGSHSQGMGLGLWLARYIAERHGGTIELDAQHSPGARFVMHLPDY